MPRTPQLWGTAGRLVCPPWDPVGAQGVGDQNLRVIGDPLTRNTALASWLGKDHIDYPIDDRFFTIIA